VGLVAGNRHRLLPRALRRAARSYLDMDAGRTFEPAVNGEQRVLQSVADAGARVVFDVGANVGDWADALLRQIPNAELHAFEIVPDIAEQLARRFADRAGVTVNAVGLGASAGDVSVHYYPSYSEGSGMLELPFELAQERRSARVVTGDAYCDEHGIAHIDFLKLDVEGVEGQVLDGFQRMLETRAVDAVQFEYGLANIESHVLLLDFHRRFDALGYDVGKVYPNHVDFRPYDRRVDEDFRGPNFIAVSRARAELRGRLAGAAPPPSLPKAPGAPPVALHTS
jgi:FkbM family methyltransferase